MTDQTMIDRLRKCGVTNDTFEKDTNKLMADISTKKDKSEIMNYFLNKKTKETISNMVNHITGLDHNKLSCAFPEMASENNMVCENPTLRDVSEKDIDDLTNLVYYYEKDLRKIVSWGKRLSKDAYKKCNKNDAKVTKFIKLYDKMASITSQSGNTIEGFDNLFESSSDSLKWIVLIVLVLVILYVLKQNKYF